MDKIIKLKLPFTEEVVTREEAERRIKEQDEPYKLEILNRIKSDHITIWHTSKNQDGWWDLCAGPHVETTGDLPSNAIALESIAGAYLFGDENGPMLQRIYGTAWENAEQLEEHQRLQAEAKRRDHRIDRQGARPLLDPAGRRRRPRILAPKGRATMRNLMEEYWKVAHVKGGYELLNTPHMASIDCGRRRATSTFTRTTCSTRWRSKDGRRAHSHQINLSSAPMNCPFHVLVFKDSPRSYRDLPIRWAELGTVYRYERSGSLNGLFRVRGFTQDDAHIFCLPDQLTDEIVDVLDLMENDPLQVREERLYPLRLTAPPFSL